MVSLQLERFQGVSRSFKEKVKIQGVSRCVNPEQSSIIANQDEITDMITKPCEEDNEIGKILYQMVKEQPAFNVDIDVFHGNSLH